jgi:transposase
MSEEFWLTDRQWQRLAPLLPNKSRGVPRVDDRRVISSIIHVLRSGGRWVDAPASYGPRKTLWIVCSQSPKWQTFSVGAGWDDIANFDVAIGDNDPVDQQL